MAIRYLAPTSTCVLTTSGSVVGSAGKYVWLGLIAPVANTACAAFYRSASPTLGKSLWSLAASPNTSTPMVGPFNVGASGVYVAISGTNASAIVALD